MPCGTPFSGKPDLSNPATCQHEWGTDGAHSNEYCKRCFKDKPTWITDTYGPVELLRDIAFFEGRTDGEVTVRRADLQALFAVLDSV